MEYGNGDRADLEGIGNRHVFFFLFYLEYTHKKGYNLL